MVRSITLLCKQEFPLDYHRKTLYNIYGPFYRTIAFTVKDATAINEEMLRSATINAKRKAEILCDASGAKLGDLIAIDYNWGELDIYSHTRFDCCEEAMAPMKACSIDIDPEDIDVSDTATFVWELV